MYNTVANNPPDNPDGEKKKENVAPHLHSKLDYSSGGSEHTHT
jgi:hypothetical protein